MRSILANERNNVKFNFLVPGDPYNAYYQHKVRLLWPQRVGSALTGGLHTRSLRSRRTTRAPRKSLRRYGAL